MSLRRHLPLFALAVFHACYSQAPAARPAYPAPAYSVTVPFAIPADFTHLDTTLKLLVSANNGPAHAFTIDTGSVGVVLPADEIPGFDPKAPGNTPGQLRYSSSGLTLDGFWTATTLRFVNPSSKQPAAEATVQVLAVTKGSCQGGGANAGRCTGNIPHMLGVGFGRGGDAVNGMGSQARNPFVNLQPMQTPQPSSAMRHGFLITPAGITFGLTDPETRNFTFVKLTPAASGSQASSVISTSAASFSSVTSTGAPTFSSVTSTGPPTSPVISTGAPTSSVISIEAQRSGEIPASAPAHEQSVEGAKATAPPFTRDYQTAPGFLTLGTHDYPMGVILIDTGLTNMIVEEPNEPSTGDLPSGQPATIHLLGDQLRYTFTTGTATTSVSPRRATWARYTHGAFVNTGLRALACFNYLYDADNGYIALRPTCQAK